MPETNQHKITHTIVLAALAAGVASLINLALPRVEDGDPPVSFWLSISPIYPLLAVALFLGARLNVKRPALHSDVVAVVGRHLMPRLMILAAFGVGTRVLHAVLDDGYYVHDIYVDDGLQFFGVVAFHFGFASVLFFVFALVAWLVALMRH